MPSRDLSIDRGFAGNLSIAPSGWGNLFRDGCDDLPRLVCSVTLQDIIAIYIRIGPMN